MTLENRLLKVAMPRFRTQEAFRYLLGYFKPYRRQLAAGTTCLFLANLLAIASPSVLRQVIDGLIAGITRTRLLQFCALFMLVALARAAVLFLQRRLLIGVAREMEYDLRNDFYWHLQKLSPEFYQGHRTGDLMARATSDLAAIRTVAGLGLISTITAVFAVTMVLPTMIVINWRLTAVAFLPLPLLAVIAQRFSKKIHEQSRIAQESYGRLSSTAQEMPTGVRVARAYRQEQSEVSKFKKINGEYVTSNIELIRLSQAFRLIIQLFIGLGFMLVFSYGGYLVITGVITTGQFFQQTLYLNYLIAPVASFGTVINLYQQGMASMGRILGILSIQPSTCDDGQTRDDVQIQGEIELRNLTFKYNTGPEPVLKEINLHIAPGQVVAFVGKVGSGKSTLMNLICGLLDSPKGQLFVDGHPVQDIPLRTLRLAIGYVPQETVLFSETVAANIAFGTAECSRESIERAAEVAALTEDIGTFPRGFDTPVGERGLTLSGGQKQRTAIARALVRNPRILILDDAFSSVDAQTEEQILRHLRQELKGRTALIVAHNLSTVKNADLIVVLNDGRIVERGTHEELLAVSGHYADLHHKQLLETELSAN